MPLKKGFALFIFIILLLAGCNGEEEKLNLQDSILEEKKGTQVMSQMEEAPIEIEYLDNQYTIKGTEITDTMALIEVDGKLSLMGNNKSYLLDLEALEWAERKEFEAELNIPASTGSFTFTKGSDGYSLYHQTEKGKKLIHGQISLEDINNYILKEDGSRLAFVDLKNKEIKLYYADKQRITVISDLPMEQLALPLEESITFSPKGGYISFLLSQGGIPKGFISYGADSGKLVHDLIYGIYPRWSHNEQYIAFLYKEDGKSVKELQLENGPIQLSDKIGIFDRRTKKINIWDEIQAPGYIIGAPGWSLDDHFLLYRTGIERPTDVRLLNREQKTITHLQEKGLLSNGANDYIERVQMNSRSIVFSNGGKEPLGFFSITALDDGGTRDFENAETFIMKEYGKEKRVNFVLVGEGILYKKDNSLYLITGDSSKCILKNGGSIKYIQYFNSGNQLVVQVEDEEGTAFLVIPLDT